MFCIDAVDIGEGENPQSVHPNRGSPRYGPIPRLNRPSSYSPTSVSKILVHVNKIILVPLFRFEKKAYKLLLLTQRIFISNRHKISIRLFEITFTADLMSR